MYIRRFLVTARTPNHPPRTAKAPVAPGGEALLTSLIRSRSLRAKTKLLARICCSGSVIYSARSTKGTYGHSMRIYSARVYGDGKISELFTSSAASSRRKFHAESSEIRAQVRSPFDYGGEDARRRGIRGKRARLEDATASRKPAPRFGRLSDAGNLPSVPEDPTTRGNFRNACKSVRVKFAESEFELRRESPSAYSAK